MSESPVDSAGFFSLATFQWLNPLLSLGSRAPLQFENLFELPNRLKSATIYTRFSAAYARNDENLLRSLFSAFGGSWVPSGLLKLLKDVCSLSSSSFLLHRMLNRAGSGQSIYVELACICCVQILGSFSLQHYFQRVSSVGLSVRTVLSQKLQEHALKAGCRAKRAFPSGRLMSYLSSDCFRLETVCIFLHYIWSATFQLIFIGAMLWHYLGWISIFSISVFVVVLPIQSLLLRGMQRARIRVSECADRRLQTTEEMLHGIRIVKLYVWEDAMRERILRLRLKEIHEQLRVKRLRGVLTAVTACTPLVCSVLTVVSFLWERGGNAFGPGDLANLFSSLVLLDLVRVIVILFPSIFSSAIEANVSVARLEKFFKQRSPPQEISVVPNDGVSLAKASIAWPSDAEDSVVFDRLSYKFELGKVTAIVGPIASGKSTLLQGIAGEALLLSGEISLPGKVGLAAQQPWIQNTTVRENILFGEAFDEARYRSSLHVACLDEDLSAFANGDSTEIGERGVTLSGGQKQRIALARLVYQNPDVVLLDDPLSALDAAVASSVFSRCVLGAFSGKTVLISLNQLQYCSLVDNILVINKGAIVESGSFTELLEKNGEFAALHNQFVMSKLQKNQPEVQKTGTVPAKETFSVIAEEERVTGAVHQSILGYFVNQSKASRILFAISIFFIIGSQIVASLAQFRIFSWIDELKLGSTMLRENSILLGIFSFVTFLLVLCCYLIMASSTGKSSFLIVQKVLKSVLNAPIAFFDSNPIGRILNRFSRDIDVLDNSIPDSISTFLTVFFSALFSVFQGCLKNPPTIPLYILSIAAFFFLQRYFRASLRELKRMDSLTRSPLFSFFSESVVGCSTVKMHNAVDKFSEKFSHMLDANNQPVFLQISSQRWLALRIESFGYLFSAIVLLGAFQWLKYRGTSDEMVESALTFLVQCLFRCTDVLNWCIRQVSELEAGLTSVERLRFYAESIDQESDPVDAANFLPKDSSISLRNVSMRYRPKAPLILNNVSLDIPSGSRFALVGRTGSGKSTVFQLLFRLFSWEDGQILIGGCDITAVPLKQLRRYMAVIPQEPVLFKGTLRDNIDPFSQHSDDLLWICLKRTSLENHFKSLEDQIDYRGENLSVGQRQLVCLTRALLSNASIILLDEATANVDPETNSHIKQVIVEQCKDRTIVTIAHRLDTISDYDHVAVISNGSVLEVGSPAKLLQDPFSHFSRLSNSA